MGSLARRSVAALERTPNRVEASAWDHDPEEKFSRDWETISWTASRGVASILLIRVSVAGLMTSMRSAIAVA